VNCQRQISHKKTSGQLPGLASSVGRCFERRQLPVSPCFGRNPQRGNDGSQPNLSLRASIQPTLPRRAHEFLDRCQSI